MELEQLNQRFNQLFSRQVDGVGYAPGRVNLIGDHTDYNQGLVLPAAINMGTWVLAAKRSDKRVNMVAVDFDDTLVSFELEQILFDHQWPWSNYIRGVFVALHAAMTNQQSALFGRQLSGVDLLIGGNLPQGAGLSSSASLEVALLRALADLFQLPIDAVLAAQLGQAAENQFVGCNCGIMDQLTAAMGRKSQAMLLDCHDLTTEFVSLPQSLALMIINSNIKRELVGSEYNDRRQQCDQVAHYFRQPSLRGVTQQMLNGASDKLDETLLRRARHVISENTRVQQLFTALIDSDLPQISRLMAASHASLRDDFEVSTKAIDQLVQIVHAMLGEGGGVRMTGGGFGGCVVALVPKSRVSTIIDDITAQYKQATGLDADIYLCRAQAGAFSQCK